MNKFEEVKAAKDGLDAWPDVERCAREGWESIRDEDKIRMKWFGIFFRRHIPGFFMLRIRIPNGIATSAQVRAVASVASDFARGEVDLTTRQQFQVRWYRIESAPAMLERLAAVDIDTRQTGMDNIRNVMGCPLAGITTHELLDASPVVRAFTQRIVGNQEFSNLPRKFNVTITGCVDNCVHLETQDIGMGPAVRMEDGTVRVGFNVYVGGKNGSGGFTPAQPLDVFVEPGEAAELAAQIALLFRDHGSREARARVRLAFLLEAWGLGRFRSALEERMGRSLAHAGRDARGAYHADHVGIAPERETGVYSVGLSVPIGRITTAQMMMAADLADAYGREELRMTPGQNLILPHVPDSKLPALLNEPLLDELRPDPKPALRGSVSCTGLGTCDLALAETKGISSEVAQRVDRAGRLGRPISISWSGCPAGCANHQVSDIGLEGGRARVNGEVIEVYDVFVGGRAGIGARAGVKVLEQVPAGQISGVVERLAAAHGAGRDLVSTGQQLAVELAGAEELREPVAAS
ncbi:MAG: ferredoxin--nitrite reductase [Chloroflexi bacterium]|nr:ferredoxin--nitrite reductase [Chloroflexota bacterium]